MNQADSELELRIRALEPPYRSRGEAQVGRLLDRYGIPFFYEHPTLIYDRGRSRVWHPDFTLPTHGSLIVEYAGMMDVPEYRQGIQHKRRVFRRNGYPALFVYPSDMRGSDWPARLYHRIAYAGQHALTGYWRGAMSYRRQTPYR